LWQNKKGYRDGSLLEDLPVKIQSELFFHINKSIIEKVPFLLNASTELVEELMSELEPRIFVPDEKIFRIDDPGDALYFVHSGRVKILNRENQEVVTLHEGAFFGEMALIDDSVRSATAIAVNFCDIYVLHKEAFIKVTAAHPQFHQHIHDVVRTRKAKAA
ncbi:MAG: cyclic nucleotide-binding domain-containing protein, partial [Bdellovibrionota bacterium]